MIGRLEHDDVDVDDGRWIPSGTPVVRVRVDDDQLRCELSCVSPTWTLRKRHPPNRHSDRADAQNIRERSYLLLRTRVGLADKVRRLEDLKKRCVRVR